MVESRIRDRKEKIGQQRKPVQERSRQRREDILKTTGILLERVGFDDLTTILIARELKISVGSLYHYFPNKQAILHAMGEHWLEEFTQAMEEVADQPLEERSSEEFVDTLLPRLLSIYKEQQGILPLVQAMWSVPELRDLDEQHDEMVISHLSRMFKRLGMEAKKRERERRARLLLELTHALLLSITTQSPAHAELSMADLRAMCLTLLK